MAHILLSFTNFSAVANLLVNESNAHSAGSSTDSDNKLLFYWFLKTETVFIAKYKRKSNQHV